jgi:hypothetical protein
MLRILGRSRDILAGIDFTFDVSTARFGAEGLDDAGRVEAFQRNRSKIVSGRAGSANPGLGDPSWTGILFNQVIS